MNNLPPGVTTNMIPGNRPEDLAEEAFWEVFFKKAEEEGIMGDLVDRGLVDDAVFTKAITIALNLGITEGFEQAKIEAAMEQAAKDAEEAEREYDAAMEREAEQQRKRDEELRDAWPTEDGRNVGL